MLKQYYSTVSKPRTHDFTVGGLGNFASHFIVNPRSDEGGIVVRGKEVYSIFPSPIPRKTIFKVSS